MSINRVNISGNLTRDPELRATGSGMQILRFGVAVNDRARNQQTGEWEDRPNFVDCVVFGNRADALSRLLSKGSKVAIEGKLRYSSWETQDGQRRSKLEVVLRRPLSTSSRVATSRRLPPTTPRRPRLRSAPSRPRLRRTSTTRTSRSNHSGGARTARYLGYRQ